VEGAPGGWNAGDRERARPGAAPRTAAVTPVPEMLLVDLQEVPECAKVRACLQLKGVPFRRTPATVGVVRRMQGGLSEALVPVLESGEVVLIGAPAIVDWLEATTPVPALRPTERTARAYCRLFEQWADRELGVLIDAVVWRDPIASRALGRALAAETTPGPLTATVARWVRWRAERRHANRASELVPRLAAACAVVEDSLVGRPYLLGDVLTVADVAVYVHLVRLDAIADAAGVPTLGAATSTWRARLDAVEALRTAIGP